MTYESPEEYHTAVAAAGYKKYLDGVRAAQKRTEELAEFDDAVADYNVVGKHHHTMRVEAVEKFTKRIEKDVTDLYAALVAADGEVCAAKAVAMAKGRAVHGKGGFVLAEFGGGRIDNITKVTRIVETILTEVTR